MKTAITRIAFASLLAAGAVNAAPFTGKGIPADAGALVHIDAEAAGNSSIFKTLKEIGEQSATKNADQREKVKKIMAELGIAESDVKDVTVVIGAPKKDEKKPAAAGHLHGKFDRKKLLALSTNHPEVKANKLGAHTWYSVADLDKAFGDKANPIKDPQGCVCPVNDTTVLFASDTAVLESNLKAIDGKSAYADAGAKTALTGASMISGYFPSSFFAAVKAAEPKTAKPAGAPDTTPKSLVFSLSEAAGDLKLHADAVMADAPTAQKLQTQIAMYQGMAPMLFGQAQPGETPAQAADKAFMMSAINAIKFTAAGDTFSVHFAFPAEKLAAKLREKKADIAAMAEQSAGAPGGSAPVAKRPVRKSAPAPVAAE
jgi:hypothetical protein